MKLLSLYSAHDSVKGLGTCNESVKSPKCNSCVFEEHKQTNFAEGYQRYKQVIREESVAQRNMSRGAPNPGL